MYICECVSVFVWESVQNRESTHKRETEIYWKKLAHVVVGACKSAGLAGDQGGIVDASSWSVKGIWSRVPSSEVPSWDLSLFNLPSTDWTGPPHIMEAPLLYSKSTYRFKS